MLLQLEPRELDAGLRALKTMAMADGRFDEHERGVLLAAADALGADIDPDAVGTIEPAELATVVRDPTLRLRAVQTLIVMALADGDATKDEAALLRRFAAALEVEERDVRDVELLAGRHLYLLRFDVMRRHPIMRQVLSATWSEEGARGMLKLVQVFRGTHTDPDLAWRYKKLGLLPEGTLGREFWAHMTSRSFGLPGELGGLPERAVHHDVTHVLAGYDTDPLGEVRIASFYAGMLDADPFVLVLGTMLMFHVGLRLSPIVTPARLVWTPEDSLRALERGRRCKVKLWADWDFMAVMDRPVAELRAEYGIGDP